jgi:hypothetical protein
MTVIPMYKYCPHCMSWHSCDPSVCGMGIFCHYRGRLALSTLSRIAGWIAEMFR